MTDNRCLERTLEQATTSRAMKGLCVSMGIRRDVLRMMTRAKTSHVGSCLSCADLVGHLYSHVMNYDPLDPRWPDRDRFVLSKGHAAAAVYAALALSGFFPVADLEQYSTDGSFLTGHVNHRVRGVEASTGSLGHGLPIGLGFALALARDPSQNRKPHVYVLMSDGECNEGTTWECALLGGHWGVDNLVAIVDYNKIQSLDRVDKVARLEPLAEKWRNFGWSVVEVNGHDHAALERVLTATKETSTGRPTMIIAHTIKGRGVSFMEDTIEWHYRAPSLELLSVALGEVDDLERDLQIELGACA